MSARSRMLIEAVDHVASAQHGMITAAQLDEIGIPSSSLQRRIRTGGPWRRVLTGIYCVMPTALSADQRDTAALLFAGPDAMITGASGLRRRGVRYLPREDAVHVLIPHTQHRKSSGFVSIERTRFLPEPEIVRGLPSVPIARAVIDAGRRITERRTTRAFTLEVVQRGLASVDALEEALQQSQRRGTALLREVITEAHDGVRSAPEAEVRQAVLTTSLPAPLWNPGLLLPNGAFLAQPDGLIVESMVALEVDSKEHHSEGDGWERTLERGTDMSNEGLLVVHIVPRKFRANPQRTLQRIRRAHEQGLSRPNPTLQVVPCEEFERMKAAWGRNKFAQGA